MSIIKSYNKVDKCNNGIFEVIVLCNFVKLINNDVIEEYLLCFMLEIVYGMLDLPRIDYSILKKIFL